MNNAYYWNSRLQEQQEILYNRDLEVVQKRLKRAYQDSLKDVVQDIKNLWDKITVKGNVSVNDLYKYNRYFELMNNLNKRLLTLGEQEILIDDEGMKNLYISIGKQINTALSNSYSFVDDRKIEETIKSVWCADGKHWSNRIWDNKQALQNRIEKGLLDCASRGVPKDEMVKQLRKDFGVAFYKADRIARTELTHVQNQSAANSYKDAGYSKYQFLAAVDDRTSDICLDLDGKIFDFSEAVVGVNFPPCHVNCRSTIIPVKD